MTHYPKLSGGKCYLSPPSPEDAEKWAEWFNDLEVAIPLGDEAYTWVSADAEREALADAARRHGNIFSILERESDKVIGRCLLFALDQVNRTAMLGLVIGEKAYWGKGFGQEATRLLLDYAFNLLNLESVALGVYAFDERAIACYRMAGFREIGRRRQARIIGGHRYDLVLMDILADEFRAANPGPSCTDVAGR